MTEDPRHFDQTLNDKTRRVKGCFYTPKPWVDYAHKMISDILGENWKDDYVVWDCACGTKNLTRDYRFKELYCSTLEQAELDISKAYNPEAKAFVFDFLNETDEDLERKCPELVQALKTKKVLFLINPPYKTVSYTNYGSDGVGKTSYVNNLMRKENAGRARQEIYAQFLYRIVRFKKQYASSDISLALFCKPKFLCGESFEEFRKIFFDAFKFECGIFFNAGHFSNVSANWGITFNIWTPGETVDKHNFPHDVVDLDENRDVVKLHEKRLYNTDGSRTLRDIIQKQKRDIEVVNFKYPSPFSVAETNVKFTKDGIGSMYFGTTSFSVSTLAYYHGHDIVITPENIDKCAIIFASHQLAPKDWECEKDTLMIPDMNHSRFKEFVNDAVVYSYISDIYDFSLRGVEYHGKTWDIPNHFFFMSREEIMNLSNTR